jgi:hypothetical protein
MANLSIKTGVISRSMLVGNSPYVPPSFESIATATGTGSNTEITFSSIPSTYKHLQIRSIYRDTKAATTRQSLYLEFNGSAGTNYSVHNLRGSGSAVTAGGFANYPFVTIECAGAGDSTTANVFGASIIDIHDYAVTTKNKTVRYFSGINDNTTTDGNQGVVIGSGAWNQTAAITSIKIICGDTAFVSGSTFSLYGIKG